jgi:hypothetical protein
MARAELVYLNGEPVASEEQRTVILDQDTTFNLVASDTACRTVMQSVRIVVRQPTLTPTRGSRWRTAWSSWVTRPAGARCSRILGRAFSQRSSSIIYAAPTFIVFRLMKQMLH